MCLHQSSEVRNMTVNDKTDMHIGESLYFSKTACEYILTCRGYGRCASVGACHKQSYGENLCFDEAGFP